MVRCRSRVAASYALIAISAEGSRDMGGSTCFAIVAQKGLPHSAVVECQRRQADWAEASSDDQPPNEK